MYRYLLSICLALGLVVSVGCSEESTSQNTTGDCESGEIFHPSLGRCVESNSGGDNQAPDVNESSDASSSDQPETNQGGMDDDTSQTDAGGESDETQTSECDQDGDGAKSVECGGGDCNDNNPNIGPSKTEQCGSIDRNCDGEPAAGLTCEFYAHTAGELYKIDPFKPRATKVGEGLPNLLDIDTHPDGTLYGVSSGYLHTFNEQQQRWKESVELGTTTGVGANGLCINGAGTIFVTAHDDILRIDARTGDLTTIGETSDTYSSGDCVVNKQGKMLRSSEKKNAMGDTDDVLVYVNERDGSGQTVGELGFKDVFGLTSAWGELYGLTENGHLIRISLEDGTGELVHKFGDTEWYGAASKPSR
jgi:hypothetical protein